MRLTAIERDDAIAGKRCIDIEARRAEIVMRHAVFHERVVLSLRGTSAAGPTMLEPIDFGFNRDFAFATGLMDLSRVRFACGGRFALPIFRSRGHEVAAAHFSRLCRVVAEFDTSLLRRRPPSL
jgi:hypothetical protein